MIVIIWTLEFYRYYYQSQIQTYKHILRLHYHFVTVHLILNDYLV